MEQILRIQMGEGTCRFEPVPAEYGLLGGRALTSRIVSTEVDPLCDPLGPGNKLVLAPGLLAGTVTSSTSRLSVGAKSPLTGGIKESNAGGNTGWRLAQHGLRAVIVEGAPSQGSWQIAVISGSECCLEPAGDLVGLGTFEAAAKLLERFGPKTAIALIGPAGEARLNVAGICNLDPEGRPTRLNARGGVGAVMGAKGLKAIVVLEPPAGAGPDLADQAGWRQASRTYLKSLADSPAVRRYRDIGTAGNLEVVNKMGALPIRNFSQGSAEEAEAIIGIRMVEIMAERGGQPRHSCMTGCAIQCSNVWTDVTGREVASSMEYETNSIMGSNLGVMDFDAIARFTREANDLGIDTIETGGAIGVAMKAGLLDFGDAEGVLDLMRQIRRGTLTGRLIGAGAATVGQVLGVREVPVVKGQTMAGYDPRVIKGLGVTYATSPMGGDHTAGQTLGLPGDPMDPAGKVAQSRDMQRLSASLDMLGLCLFTRSVYLAYPEQIRALLAARLGYEVTDTELRSLAEETIRCEIAFNRRAGLGAGTDRIPEWMQVTPLSPQGAVFDVSGQEMDQIWEGEEHVGSYAGTVGAAQNLAGKR